MAVRLRPLTPEFAIVRLDPGGEVPAWAGRGSLTMVTRSPDELSILVEADLVPEGVQCERGWCGVVIVGPLPFTLTGVLASVLQPLADAAIPILAMSTFDTDYVFVKGSDRMRAMTALTGAGHVVVQGA